jgi:hypothetical protein
MEAVKFDRLPVHFDAAEPDAPGCLPFAFCWRTVSSFFKVAGSVPYSPAVPAPPFMAADCPPPELLLLECVAGGAPPVLVPCANAPSAKQTASASAHAVLPMYFKVGLRLLISVQTSFAKIEPGTTIAGFRMQHKLFTTTGDRSCRLNGSGGLEQQWWRLHV